MNQHHFTGLKTARLILRQPTTSDWKMISYLRSSVEVNKYVHRPRAETKEKALAYISKTILGIDDQKLYYWVITEKNSDQMIGSICLWNLSEDGKTAEVGYDLNPKFQRRGIMNESLKCILDFGFNTLQLEVIEAYTQRRNEPSKKLLERNGFKWVVGKKDANDPENIIYQIKNNGKT